MRSSNQCRAVVRCLALGNRLVQISLCRVQSFALVGHLCDVFQLVGKLRCGINFGLQSIEVFLCGVQRLLGSYHGRVKQLGGRRKRAAFSLDGCRNRLLQITALVFHSVSQRDQLLHFLLCLLLLRNLGVSSSFLGLLNGSAGLHYRRGLRKVCKVLADHADGGVVPCAVLALSEQLSLTLDTASDFTLLGLLADSRQRVLDGPDIHLLDFALGHYGVHQRLDSVQQLSGGLACVHHVGS